MENHLYSLYQMVLKSLTLELIRKRKGQADLQKSLTYNSVPCLSSPIISSEKKNPKSV
ncbi:hypothetical protein [Thermocrinis sp.]|uniref:hypothetical protein n=1 Tax=Thermocrinis sp. TaxID=2024383 RepID=UPI003C0B1377